MDSDKTAVNRLDRIAEALGGFLFTVIREDDLQVQVAKALQERQFFTQREVHEDVLGPAMMLQSRSRQRSRFDIVIGGHGRGAAYLEWRHPVILELKLKASVAAVERQAQRYALAVQASGVIVATTSSRLHAGLCDMTELGGRPFRSVLLRTF